MDKDKDLSAKYQKLKDKINKNLEKRVEPEKEETPLEPVPEENSADLNDEVDTHTDNEVVLPQDDKPKQIDIDQIYEQEKIKLPGVNIKNPLKRNVVTDNEPVKTVKERSTATTEEKPKTRKEKVEEPVLNDDENEGDNSQGKNYKNRKKSNWAKVLGNIILTIVILAALVFAGYEGWWYYNNNYSHAYNTALVEIKEHKLDLAQQNLQVAVKDYKSGKRSIPKSEYNSLLLWASYIPSVYNWEISAKSKLNDQDASLSDLLSVQSTYNNLKKTQADISPIGDIEAKDVLIKSGLIYDSVIITILAKCGERVRDISQVNNHFIYNDGIAQLDLTQLKKSVNNPQNPEIAQGIKERFAYIENFYFAVHGTSRSGNTNANANQNNTSTAANTPTPVNKNIQTAPVNSVNNKSNDPPSSGLPKPYQVKYFLVGRTLCTISCTDINKISSLAFKKPKPNGETSTVRITFDIEDETGELNSCEGDLTFRRNGNEFQIVGFVSS